MTPLPAEVTALHDQSEAHCRETILALTRDERAELGRIAGAMGASESPVMRAMAVATLHAIGSALSAAARV